MGFGHAPAAWRTCPVDVPKVVGAGGFSAASFISRWSSKRLSESDKRTSHLLSPRTPTGPDRTGPDRTGTGWVGLATRPACSGSTATGCECCIRWHSPASIATITSWKIVKSKDTNARALTADGRNPRPRPRLPLQAWRPTQPMPGSGVVARRQACADVARRAVDVGRGGQMFPYRRGCVITFVYSSCNEKSMCGHRGHGCRGHGCTQPLRVPPEDGRGC